MLSLHGSDGACSSVAIKVSGVNYGFRIADFEESGVFYHGLLIRRILSLRILNILFRCVHYVVAFGHTHTHIYIYIHMYAVCMYVRTYVFLASAGSSSWARLHLSRALWGFAARFEYY